MPFSIGNKTFCYDVCFLDRPDQRRMKRFFLVNELLQECELVLEYNKKAIFANGEAIPLRLVERVRERGNSNLAAGNQKRINDPSSIFQSNRSISPDTL